MAQKGISQRLFCRVSGLAGRVCKYASDTVCSSLFFSFFMVLAVTFAAAVLTASCSRKKPMLAVFSNSVGMNLVGVPVGKFMMGSIEDASQMPVHEVSFAKPFLIASTVVTQQQWKAVMGTEPWIGEDLKSVQLGADRPAVNMLFEDAREFCRKLSALEGKNYRLPSEAEWEYAARAGSKGRWFFGDNTELLVQYAWYDTNSKSLGYVGAHPVAQLKPNAYGLYDVYGNVWEFCEDIWQGNYNGAPADGSVWALGEPDSDRVMRGGSHYSTPERANSTVRYNVVLDKPYENVGFRVVRETEN
ncbi:MAG: formylglycine-generating enzyme family protein [Holophagaceae bacterium]|nr:formylglycine-generating enzyme family protein [Holophagaceae bacterium]